MDDGVTSKLPKDERLDRLRSHWEEFHQATQNRRQDAATERDYYDGKQWSDTEIGELTKRNQPIVTINRIAPKINFVIGTEISTRVDPTAYPRTPEHEDDAHVVEDALRYVADKEQFDLLRTAIATEICIEGCSAAIATVKRVMHQGEELVDIHYEHIPWDRFFYDPRSRRADFSDAGYLGIIDWFDYNEAIRNPEYAGKEDVFQSTRRDAQDDMDTHSDRPRDWAGWYDSKRNRIRISEVYWYEIDDDGSRCWYGARHTGAGFLVEPYKIPFVDEDGHNWCPIVATSGFVSRENERYGIVKHLISPQDEINKRRSKLLHLLANRQVIAEEDAVPNQQEAQTELAKPDGWITVAPNALAESRFQKADTGDVAQGHMALMQEAKNEIDLIGPHAALSASDQRVMSGRAFLARQEAGSQELRPVFDNLRSWTIALFRRTWWLIKQFWAEERWIRVRDDIERRGWRFVQLNRPMAKSARAVELIQKGMPPPEAVRSVLGSQGEMMLGQAMQIAQMQTQQTGQQIPPEMLQQFALRQVLSSPLAQEMMTVNDVARLDVDIIIDTIPDTAIIQHEQFTELAGLAKQGLPIPPDMIIEASMLRNKRQLLTRLKEQGQPNPMQVQQMQLQIAQMQAEIQKLQADAAKSMAQAQQIQAETEMIPAEAEEKQANAMRLAADAGQKVVPSFA